MNSGFKNDKSISLKLTSLILVLALIALAGFLLVSCSSKDKEQVPDENTIFDGDYVTPADGNGTQGENNLTPTEGLTFTLVDDNAYVVAGFDVYNYGYSYSPEKIVIPAKYNGLPVVGISDTAFNYKSFIKSVYFSANIKSIDPNCFSGCDGIETLQVDARNYKYKSVDNCIIEKHTNTLVFGCKTSVIPSDGSVKTIGEYAFSGVNFEGDDFAFNVPDGVTTIGECAFARSTIKRVSISNSVTTISQEAFEFSGLQEVTLPSGITALDHGIFRDCRSLTSVILPSGLKSIGADAFCDCEHLKAITLPDGLETIGDSAFFQCYELSSINFPNTVTEIGGTAFRSCNRIESIVLPNSVTKVGSWAFVECGALKSVQLSSNLEKIESLTFGRTKIEEIVIPDGVKTIETSAFSECPNLKTISISKTVTSIGMGAFATCESIESIIVDAENECYASEGNCLIDVRTHTLIFGFKNAVIPSSVKTIAQQAFKGSAIRSLVVPEGVETIEMLAFDGCKDLISITLPSTLRDYGMSLFDNCKRLVEICNKSSLEINPRNNTINGYSQHVYSEGESKIEFDPNGFVFLNDGEDKVLVAYFGDDWQVVVPAGTTMIGGNAFLNRDLIHLTIPSSVQTVNGFAFTNCDRLVEIYNQSSADLSSNYHVYSNEGESAITQRNGFLLFDSGWQGICVVGYIGDAREITLPNDVQRVNAKAFKDRDVISVTLPEYPNGITIALGAFGYNENLADIYFEGTMRDFVFSVSMTDPWNYYTGKRIVIHCTDGDIDEPINDVRLRFW